MDIIGREGSILFLFIDRLFIKTVNNCQALNDSRNEIFGAHIFIGLDAGQAKRSDPLHRVTSVGDCFRAFGKPVFYIVHIFKEVTNALYCDLCQVF